MEDFDDKIPARDFDNVRITSFPHHLHIFNRVDVSSKQFQFVNFTELMSQNQNRPAVFAVTALMEIPGLAHVLLGLFLERITQT